MMFTDIIIILFDIAILILLLVIGWAVIYYLPSHFDEIARSLGTKADIEDIAEQIDKAQTYYVAEIEVLRAQLNRESHAYNIPLEKEFENLSELWEALLKLQKATSGLETALETSYPDLTEEEQKITRLRLQRFAESFNSLSALVSSKRPFYPQEIYAALVRIMSIAETQTLDYQIGAPIPDEQERVIKYWQSVANNAQEISERIDNLAGLIRKRVAI